MISKGFTTCALACFLFFAFAGSLDQPKPLLVEHLNSATVLGQPALRETTSYFLLVVPPAKEDTG